MKKRARVDHEMARLTTDRISGSPSRKRWDCSSLLLELRPLLIQFAGDASPARLSPKVRTLIDFAK